MKFNSTRIAVFLALTFTLGACVNKVDPITIPLTQIGEGRVLKIKVQDNLSRAEDFPVKVTLSGTGGTRQVNWHPNSQDGSINSLDPIGTKRYGLIKYVRSQLIESLTKKGFIVKNVEENADIIFQLNSMDSYLAGRRNTKGQSTVFDFSMEVLVKGEKPLLKIYRYVTSPRKTRLTHSAEKTGYRELITRFLSDTDVDRFFTPNNLQGNHATIITEKSDIINSWTLGYLRPVEIEATIPKLKISKDRNQKIFLRVIDRRDGVIIGPDPRQDNESSFSLLSLKFAYPLSYKSNITQNIYDYVAAKLTNEGFEVTTDYEAPAFAGISIKQLRVIDDISSKDSNKQQYIVYAKATTQLHNKKEQKTIDTRFTRGFNEISKGIFAASRMDGDYQAILGETFQKTTMSLFDDPKTFQFLAGEISKDELLKQE